MTRYLDSLNVSSFLDYTASELDTADRHRSGLDPPEESTMAATRSVAQRRYMRRVWPTWLIYVVVLLGSKWLLESQPSGVLKYLIAIAPALPLVTVIVLVGQLMYSKEDEFQRALWAEAMLWGAAITMAATTLWGFLEIAGAPPIRLYWVFPFFTGAALACVPFLSRKYE
jgi:hypothetical protein